MLTKDDVGRRVVVRRVVDTDTARPAYADTIGQLISADEAGLVVRPDRGGADVAIERARVVAAKPVPPRRRRVTVEELERIAAETWPAVHRDRLGDWLLRAAGGWTGRANSALVVGDPGV
ncbi:MAG: GNAT family N-acetyltransferase, partial [Actinocatenispora sp.]